MGGNILLNALPHLPEGTPVIGAATVSAPIDPTAASQQLMKPRNRVYQKSLLKEMKRFWLARPEAEDAAMRDGIQSADSIWDFDDRVTGPHIGYAGAAEYYDATAGIKKIADIRIPLLLIHAANDPWIPARSYFSLPLQDNVRVEIAASGGHVGFHGADPQPWHDLRIAAFIAGLNGREVDHDLPFGARMEARDERL
jgi:predicted alpha/beta-fold hydrolase